MTDITLGGGSFALTPLRPGWERLAIVALVVGLHAAALATSPYLARKSPEPATEVIVDIQPETAPAEPTTPEQTPAAPEAPKEPEAATEPPAPSPLPPPQELAPPNAEEPPVAVAPPPEQLPPEPPPPPTIEQPPLPPPEPPPTAPVELAPPKPPPPPPKIEARKPPSKPVERPAPVRAERRRASAEEPRTAPSTSAPASSAAGAASMSAYTGEVSAAIRSRMFYPPAARARQARGVVGVSFTIGPSGVVTSFAITRSSGDGDLDAAARTLVRTARFPPPPNGSAHISTSFNYVPG